MKRQTFLAAMMFAVIAAGPATKPASTFASRAEEYLRKVSWMNLPKDQQAKIRRDAIAVDEAVRQYLAKEAPGSDVAAAMQEGRIVPGMPEAALEIIIQPYRGHLTQTETSKQYECATRNPGDESRYAVSITQGRVVAVSSMDH